MSIKVLIILQRKGETYYCISFVCMYVHMDIFNEQFRIHIIGICFL